MPHQVSAGHSTFGRTASGPAVGVMAISSTLLAPCTASISQLLTGATAKASWARVGLAATKAALSRRAEEERLGCRVQITGREEWQ